MLLIFHSRRTNANEPLYKDPGTAFVYLTYGMYHCFNIHSKEPGSGVFLRALEPVEGTEEMRCRRLGNLFIIINAETFRCGY